MIRGTTHGSGGVNYRFSPRGEDARRALSRGHVLLTSIGSPSIGSRSVFAEAICIATRKRIEERIMCLCDTNRGLDAVFISS